MKLVISEISNERIDAYLGKQLDYSRSKVQKMLKSGDIKVNESKVKSSYTLKIGDIVEVNDDYDIVADIKPQAIAFEIVYEDDDLLVINKPNGLVVHPGAGNFENTLVNGLVFHFENLSKANTFRPGLVHRLDAYTTGLMVVAKNDEVHDFLKNEILKNKMMRKYYALVWGIIKNDTGMIDAPIGRDAKDRKKFAVTANNSKKAITHFRVLKRFKEATLVEATLETGRTHQIRVHFAYINHPIVNDAVYGKRKIIDDSGQCLHAKTLSFNHPKTNEFLTFDSELSISFNNILKQFGEGELYESNEN